MRMLLLALEERGDGALVDAEEPGVEAEVPREAGPAHLGEISKAHTSSDATRSLPRGPALTSTTRAHEIVEVARVEAVAGEERVGVDLRRRARLASVDESRCLTSRMHPRCSGVNASSLPSSTARIALSGMKRSFWSCRTMRMRSTCSSP